jgi:hypothetical protein
MTLAVAPCAACERSGERPRLEEGGHDAHLLEMIYEYQCSAPGRSLAIALEDEERAA